LVRVTFPFPALAIMVYSKSQMLVGTKDHKMLVDVTRDIIDKDGPSKLFI
jgi:hypothetical protein